jgi:hypothetical protein
MPYQQQSKRKWQAFCFIPRGLGVGFSVSGLMSQFSRPNLRVDGLQTGPWPETGMWEITPHKSASIRQPHWHRHLDVKRPTLSCTACRPLLVGGTPTIRSSGFLPRNAPNSIRRPWGVSRYLSFCYFPISPWSPNWEGEVRAPNVASRTQGRPVTARRVGCIATGWNLPSLLLRIRLRARTSGA